MLCPECSFEQPDSNTECTMCGVIFSRLQANNTAPPLSVENTHELLRPNAVDQATLINMGIGLALALVCIFINLTRIITTCK